MSSAQLKKIKPVLRVLALSILCFISVCSSASVIRPDTASPDYRSRKWIIGGLNAAVYGTSFIALNSAWYKDFPRRSFHSFNDSKEWLQVDKIGHGWSAYHISRMSSLGWQWAGVPQKKAAWIGGLTGVGYLTIIEILDARSAKWGWSWADMAANVVGPGLFISQELLWQQQKIQWKFSFHTMKYDEPQLKARADDLYGKSWYEKMLKDYNGQTYWLSANISSFFPSLGVPGWLNLSLGYGASGLLGGFENKWTDENQNIITRYDVPRRRQFYLSPDIDFTRIKTGSRFLRTVFQFLNGFKMPAPALMIDNGGKMRFYLFYF